MVRFFLLCGMLCAVAGFVGLWLTKPVSVSPEAVASLTGDATAGEGVFHAAGCASCHAAPKADGDAKLVLAGGQRLPSPFGTFIAPNISPSALADWDLADMVSALRYGTSPEGQHYYPAFPYGSYSLMSDQQIADLWAYLQTLPADPTPNAAHELGFPFSIRASVGGWKFLYLKPEWVMETAATPQIERGRELVEALGHCAECHTPRTLLGGMDRSRWMQGAPSPDGQGRVPPLTPDQLTWSETDIAYYLETGFTPDFDSSGGHMVDVIENFAKLTPEDRAAVAAYLKALN